MSYLKTKPGSLEEAIRKNDEDYQAMFKIELEKTGNPNIPSNKYKVTVARAIL